MRTTRFGCEMKRGKPHRLLCPLLHFLLVALSLCGAELKTFNSTWLAIRQAFSDALQDQNNTLRVGAFVKEPFVTYDESNQGNGRFGGISVEQMKHLSSAFAFDVCVLYVPLREPGAPAGISPLC